MLTRKESLALIGAAFALPSCAGRGSSDVIRVGSKNFSENITVAEIYAAALERAHFRVERHMNLGSTQIATAAIQRGDIDLYPEYTGTGLIDVLHQPPMRDASALFNAVNAAYRKQFSLTWLSPAPANDSQALATTQTVASRYNLHTLSSCSTLAARLRLAAIPEFVARADALPGLQKFYGGFKFAQVNTYTIGLQYDALTRGDADVATAFTTDSQIASDNLVLLQDDKHFWPPYNIAPVVRLDTLQKHAQIATALNGISPKLTDAVLRRLNQQVNVQKMDPADAAAQFLGTV